MLFNIFVKYLAPIISPTYLIRVYLKNYKSDNKLLNLNIFYFYLSCLLTIFLLYYLPYLIGKKTFLFKFLFFIFVYYCISRGLEIFLVFLLDSIEKIKYQTKPKHGLNYYNKFILALRNYFELIFTYATIYYTLNTYYLLFNFREINFFNTDFDNIYEALYLSANTITLLGYGDIYPTHLISQFFSIFQVISGAYILIVTFTLYVTLNFANPDYLNDKSGSNKKKRKKSLIIIQILIIFLLIIGGAIISLQ